jgi:spermidine synthase
VRVWRLNEDKVKLVLRWPGSVWNLASRMKWLTIPLLAGFSAAVGQIILLREVVVIFNGNELSLGIVLAAWLAWTAAGSRLAGRLACDHADARVPLAVTVCLFGISLPLSILALREARVLLQAVPGEPLDPASMALVCLVCLSVFCATSGSLFTLGAQLVRQIGAVSQHSESSYVYLLDTAGFALGGVVTSILLLRVFGCVQIAFLVALLCICIGAALFFRMSGRAVAEIAGGAVLLAIPVLLFVAPRIEVSTLKRLWAGFELRDFRESLYGRLVILEAGGMRSIYDNGSILANIPDPAAAEESVHYALLEHPTPRTVLLIGGGMAGSIAEALKHPTVERLEDVEIDPTLIEMARRLFPQDFLAFSDPRVHVHVTDGRAYLQTSSSRFDVIIADVPDPASAQLNRFYTSEFFRSAREHLAPGGVFAFQVHASEDYISPELAAFLRCVNRTLQEVFAQVVVIPGESFHFFASTQPSVLTRDPLVLISRLKNRNLQTIYVREYFIPYRMMPDRMAQATDLLTLEQGIPANHDFHPAAYYFSIVLWSVQFSHRYARLLETAQQIPAASLIEGLGVVLAALVLFFIWSGSRQKRARATAVWCVTATGYTSMTLQLLVLLLFQALFGYLYHELALLIGMFMAGIAAGSWLGIRYARGRRRVCLLRATAIDQALLAIAAPLVLAMVSLAEHGYHGGALAVTQVMFPALAFVAAIPGGHQFAIASAMYLEGSPAGKSLATLYSVDLLGGCAGALILAGFLIPVYGFWNVAWITALINGAGAALAMGTGGESGISILNPTGHARGRPVR